MEKALETIKKHIKDLERMVDVFSFYGCFSSAAECKKANKELNEAIAELEEAMKPKTCNECEWWDFNSYGIFKKCFNGKGNCVSTKSSFGCNRFKQKDNA